MASGIQRRSSNTNLVYLEGDDRFSIFWIKDYTYHNSEQEERIFISPGNLERYRHNTVDHVLGLVDPHIYQNEE